MRDRCGPPWTMAQRCHLQLVKPQSQGNRGWAVILETEVPVQQPRYVPGCSPFTVQPPSPVPHTAAPPTQWEQATLAAVSPELFFRRRRPLSTSLFFPKTRENEINYFGLKDFKFLRKADLLSKNLTPSFFLKKCKQSENLKTLFFE